MLTGLTLSLLMVSLAINAFSGLKTSSNSLENKLNTEYSLVKLFTLSNKVVSDFDRHRFKIYPRIHPAGEISLYNHTSLPINNPNNHPDPQSQAISYLSIEPQGVLKVNRREHNLHIICPVFNIALDNQKLKAFIGFSNNKILYLLAQNDYLPENKCWRSSLTNTASFYLPEDPAEVNYLIYLLPVYEDYTIYKSESGLLRYLGVKGSQIIENQPLSLMNNMNFKFSEDSTLGDNFYTLNLQVLNNYRISRRFKLYSGLRRHEIYNFIFNLQNET